MKKFTLFAVALMCAIAVNAQTMQVKSGGSVVYESNVNEIDEVTFQENASTDPAFFFKKSILKLNWGESLGIEDLLVRRNVVGVATYVSSDPNVVSVNGDTIASRGFGSAIVEASLRISYGEREGETLKAAIYVIVTSEAYMYVSERFSIAERGTVVIGKVQGKLPDDKIISCQPIVYGFLDETKDPVIVSVEAMEMFQKILDEAIVGDNVGMVLGSQIAYADAQIGDIIFIPNTTTFHRSKTIRGNLYLYTKEEGGRHTPVALGYTPQMFVETKDMTVKLTDMGVVDGEVPTLIHPGTTVQNVEFQVTSAVNPYTYIGQTVVLREGGRKVGILTIIGY